MRASILRTLTIWARAGCERVKVWDTEQSNRKRLEKAKRLARVID